MNLELKSATTKPESNSITTKINQMPLKELNPTNLENKALIPNKRKVSEIPMQNLFGSTGIGEN